MSLKQTEPHSVRVVEVALCDAVAVAAAAFVVKTLASDPVTRRSLRRPVWRVNLQRDFRSTSCPYDGVT